MYLHLTQYGNRVHLTALAQPNKELAQQMAGLQSKPNVSTVFVKHGTFSLSQKAGAKLASQFQRRKAVDVHGTGEKDFLLEGSLYESTEEESPADGGCMYVWLVQVSSSGVSRYWITTRYPKAFNRVSRSSRIRVYGMLRFVSTRGVKL